MRAVVRAASRAGAAALLRNGAPRVRALPARAAVVLRSMPVRGFAALPPHTPMAMPALSPTMEKGTIAKWRKKEGDALNPGDVIAEVETDKATVDFECQDSGYLAKILVADGTSDVPVGQLVAIMVDSLEAAAAFANISIADLAGGAPAAAAAPAPAPAAATPAAAAPAPAAAARAAPAPSGGRVVASPLAKKLAADAGLPLSAVGGTGPGGRIIAADIREAAAAGVKAAAAPAAAVAAPAAAAPAPAAVVADARGGFVDIPHTSMRRVIAQRLTASKQQVPHYTLTMDVSLDALLGLRAKLNADLPEGSKLSVNDFLVKASALALRKVPEANASWLESGIRSYDYVDVAVAVAIPDGLVTPIVRDADAKGLSAIGSSVKALVEKARAKKLAPSEFQGGTFTISNLGMFGVRQFSAIINPPQAAILAVGAAERKVVPNTDKSEGASPFKQSVIMSATLSCDHRVIDGAVGAQWLSAFRGFVENPQTMLL